MSELLFPILFMLFFVCAEACVLQFTRRQNVDWLDIIFNLNSGHIILWSFRCLEVLCYGFVLKHCSLNLLEEWSVVGLWLLTLLIWDFGFYWLHRLHHQFRLLWAVHVVHHQGENYNLSLGMRNSWYSSLTSIPFFWVLALAGVPLSVFLTVSIVHYSIQFFNHNALTPKLGWLEKIFVTPTHHRVHHLDNKRYADTNYGGTFIFWDKLFGTFCETSSQGKSTYGVKGRKPSLNPMQESNLPFLQMAGILKTVRLRPRQFDCPIFMTGIGAILLFALVLCYIQRYGYSIDNVDAAQSLLFILLAAGSVALGGISEGQRWGVMVWCLVTLSLPLLFVGLWGWNHAYWVAVMAALAVHGILLTYGLGRRIKRGVSEPV